MAERKEPVVLVERAEALLTRAEDALERAEALGDPKETAGTLREVRACLELLGRVTGELDGRATTNIAVVLGELAASGRQAIAANPHARVLDIVAPEDSQSSGAPERAPDQHVSGAGHTKSPPSEAQRP